MNKILCLLLFALANFGLRAQITYPSVDFAEAGDTFLISKARIDSLNGYNFQQTGAGYTWNYISLSAQSQYTDRYITPSSSGYRLSFITSCIAGGVGAAGCNNQWNSISNLAEQLPDSLVLGPFKFSNEVDFYSKTNAGLSATLIGMSLGLNNITYPITEKYIEPDTVYHFPLAYGNTDSCNSSYEINLSDIGLNYTYSVNTHRVNDIEGWGSITTPYASFASVLKLRSTTYSFDTMTYDSSVIPIPPDTMITYSWFATAYARPVLEVTGLVTNGALYYTDVEYIDSIRCLTPLATFNYSPLDPYLGASTPSVSVSFNNTSNNANIFEWNFGDTASGDANISPLSSPSHSYDSAGVFKVTLIACNSYCSPQQCDTIVLPVTVFDSTNVQAGFSYLPLQPCTGDTVTFTNSSLNSSSWAWNFGDGTISSQKNPQKVYNLSGTYTVTLVATGSGISDTAQQTVTLGALPLAIITPSGSVGLCTGQSVILVASGGQTYRWSTGSVKDSITVSNSGTYMVTAYNNCGNSVSQPTTIRVQTSSIPIISITSPADTVCPGNAVSFMASITNGGLDPAYQWYKNGTAVGTDSVGYSDLLPGNNDSVWCVLTSSATCVDTNIATSNKIKITLKQQPVYTYSQSICQGQGYNFNGRTLTVNGTYYDTLTASNGCDSFVVVTLIVKPVATGSFTASFCAGTGYNFNGKILTQGGIFNDTLTAANGCDSIITLNLTVRPNSASTVTASICAGTTYSFKGQNLTKTGTYYDTLISANGCDSIVTLNLTVKPNSASTITASICAGSSYNFKGQSLIQQGTYYDTLTSANGCDSIVTLNLAVKPNSASSITESICAGSSYSFKGQNLTEAGTYYDTFISANGCDSIETLNLTVKPNSTDTITASMCAGSTYSFKGQDLTEAGTYYDTLTSANGCDSIVTLNLTVKPNAGYTIAAGVCTGNSYSFKGQDITQSGTYYDTLTSTNGCDSIITLDLTVNSTLTDTENISLCAGQTLNFNGKSISQPGVYIDTFVADGGCDSIVVIDVNGYTVYSDTINGSICQGNGYDFLGRSVTVAGFYTDTLFSVHGCDSVITLHLTVKPPSTFTITDSICAGSSYNFAGQNLTQSGSYYDTLIAASGCDSIVTLFLQVKPVFNDSISAVICSGLSYPFDGKNLFAAGIYTDTITAQNGCDSIVVLRLAVNTLPDISLILNPDTICNNGGVLTLDGNPAGGTYSGSGVSGSIFYPDSVSPGPYAISYSYTDSLDCTAEISDTAVVVNCLGIDQPGIRNFVTFSPNPAQNMVTVKWQSAETSDKMRLVVYDLMGREIMSDKAEGSSSYQQLDVSILANGLYVVKLIIQNGNTLSGKLAIDRQ